MLAAYLACLGFSGVMLAASVLGASKEQGGDHDGNSGDHGDGDAGDHDAGDHDAGDHDAGDHDHSHDHGPAHEVGAGDHAHSHAAHASHAADGVGALVVATLLSLRFWTYALAAFGLSGTLLTLLSTPEPLTGGLAAGMALLCGGLVSYAMRALNRGQASGSVSTRELAGRDAEIVLSVGPGKLGKIRLTHQGQIVELPARTSEDRLLERKEPVLVVEIRDGVAEITSPRPNRPPRQPVTQ